MHTYGNEVVGIAAYGVATRNCRYRLDAIVLKYMHVQLVRANSCMYFDGNQLPFFLVCMHGSENATRKKTGAI